MTMELRFSHGAEACRSAAAERDLRHVAVVGFANIVEWELVRFVDALGNTEVIAQRPAPALWASDADTGPSGCVEDVMVQERAARGPRREVMAQHSLEQAMDEGSVAHEANACKPCIFHYHGVCTKGETCNQCHLGHSSRQMRRAQPSRLKRDRLRSRLSDEAEAQGRSAAMSQAGDSV